MIEKGFFHPDLGYWQTVGGEEAVDDYPAGTVEVPLKPNDHHEWINGEWVYNEPEPPITIIPSVTLWERMSEDEAVQVEAAMSTQPFRTRQIFMTAQTFRSDHELWPLLEQTAIGLFGDARAAELLKQP
ncbi:hypothetical protein [Paenochrobactrum glaciei]|uniref:Uncharacterized protein n=1 Tax=Paenochrobactrum glaciei TaxID=486407 RepID=A0ABN1GMY2_9HYPH